MGALDALLKMIAPGEGETLVLTAGQAPVVVFEGGSRNLSMPPLGATMVETFAREVVPAEKLAGLVGDAVVTERALTDAAGWLEVSASRDGGDLVVSFCPASSDEEGEEPGDAVEVAGEAAETARPVKPHGALASAPTAPAPSASGQPVPYVAPAPTVSAGAAAAAAPAPRKEVAPLLQLLRRAAETGASDVFFSVGASPWVRGASGTLDTGEGSAVTEGQIRTLLGSALGTTQRATLARDGSADLAWRLAPGLPGERARQFRVNLFYQSSGLAAAFRPLPDRAPTLSELSLPASLRTLVEFPHGLVLLTGATGSGKSTTLAALVEHLNRTRARHVITLEDPIEYRYQRGRSLVHQREVGTHVASFATGLRAALREAPDVILLGEMRDLETISAALTAAETGHLVLSTLHCGSAAMAIDRVLDVFPEHQQGQVRLQLSDVLRCVVSQRLLPRLGEPGRLPALEILRVNHAVANLIREKRTHTLQSYLQTGREDGMISLDRSLAQLVQDGRISRESAFAATHTDSHLAELIGPQRRR